jgi:hypothetical protein
MQYYLNYTLGIPRDGNKKADKGTIVHKVLEVLAKIKKEKQTNPEATSIVEEDLGKVEFPINWLEPYVLDEDKIIKINKTRVNKNNYEMPCFLEIGHIRFGVELVEHLIDRVYEYYTVNSTHTWMPVDFKDCTNWTWMALDYKNGLFDPRRRSIVDAEPHFDFEVKHPWAEYYYELPDGTEVVGNLALKGTIDLVTEVKPGIIEIVDWKTGRRWDWGNDCPKDYPKLEEDPQLMLYYYAAKQLYPDAKHVTLSIFFVRAGGPFSMCFDDETIEKFEGMLKQRFDEIRTCKNPEMISSNQSNFKCTKICSYYKHNWPGTDTNICKHIKNNLNTIGMEETTKQFIDDNHHIDKYEAPGELKE